MHEHYVELVQDTLSIDRKDPIPDWIRNYVDRLESLYVKMGAGEITPKDICQAIAMYHQFQPIIDGVDAFMNPPAIAPDEVVSKAGEDPDAQPPESTEPEKVSGNPEPTKEPETSPEGSEKKPEPDKVESETDETRDPDDPDAFKEDE